MKEAIFPRTAEVYLSGVSKIQIAPAHMNHAIDVVLVSLLLILNMFLTFLQVLLLLTWSISLFPGKSVKPNF